MTVVMMLIFSIIGNLCAQTASNKVFDIAQGSINRVFSIELDKGEKMKFELNELADLDRIDNIDSVIRLFLQDIEPLRDSLADELKTRRIDYLVDAAPGNKVRLQQFSPTGNSYLVNNGAVAALKLEQDTVYIIIQAPGAALVPFKKQANGVHYFRVSFYLNSLGNLTGYMGGRLQESVRDIKKHADGKWARGKAGIMYSRSQPAISSNFTKGQTTQGDYLNVRLSADIQNYKNVFVPSLSFGFTVVTNRYNVKREYSLMSESHFSFAKTDSGKLQTFRNTFISLGYYHTKTGDDKSNFWYSPSISIGWLARQRGTLYDKNTFRIGFGRVMIFGDKVKLEPVVYFNDFFKGVTPGIRLSF